MAVVAAADPYLIQAISHRAFQLEYRVDEGVESGLMMVLYQMELRTLLIHLGLLSVGTGRVATVGVDLRVGVVLAVRLSRAVLSLARAMGVADGRQLVAHHVRGSILNGAIGGAIHGTGLGAGAVVFLLAGMFLFLLLGLPLLADLLEFYSVLVRVKNYFRGVKQALGNLAPPDAGANLHTTPATAAR